MSNSKLAKDLLEAVRQETGTKPYDTTAEVLRVENDIVWVHIDNGAAETPCQRTIDAKPGDIVKIRVAAGVAWITGNQTAPPTDDKVANAAKAAAAKAFNYAEEAHVAAEDAKNTADSVHAIAEQAQEDADTATEAARSALNGLSTVESVVDTVNWFAEHKKASTDTTVDNSKTYYTFNATTGALAKVTPVGTENPSQEGWFELDEAVADYVASHVALTNDGLYVMADGSDWKVLVANDGVYIVDDNNDIIAKYRKTTLIGKADGSHIQIDDDSIDFYLSETEMAGYMSASKTLFPVLEARTSYIADKYVWRSTPGGNLGLYLR